jgi:hypothetical protein
MRFTINFTKYEVSEYPGGWGWVTVGGFSTGEESGRFFATACEAQQDAIDHEQQKTWDEEEAMENALSDARYGTYEEQVYRAHQALIHS